MIINSLNNHPINLDRVCYFEKFTKNPNVSGGTPSIQFHFSENFSLVWVFSTESQRDEAFLNISGANI